MAIPAHDEAALIADCLRSVQAAASHPALAGEQVSIMVALDRCRDATADIAAGFGVQTVELAAGNVGLARAAATTALLSRGVRWIASTDADTRVPDDWLAAQLGHECDMFLGIVQVEDWRGYHPAMPVAFGSRELSRDHHPHVHGANMGFAAEAYRCSGGYAGLACGEDVALVAAFMNIGARIARSPSPPVTTSARVRGRAVGGFSDYLWDLNQRLWSESESGRTLAVDVP